MVFADAAIHVLCEEKSQAFSDVLAHFHANELLLNVAVPIDRATELTSIFSEVLSNDATCSLIRTSDTYDRLANGHFHRSRQTSDHTESTVVQNIHRHLRMISVSIPYSPVFVAYFESIANATDDILHGYFAVFEVDLSRVRRLDAHLLLRWSVREATELSLDDERRHLVLRLSRLIVHGRCLSEHGEHLSNATVGNPDLRTVDDVVFAVCGKLGFRFDRGSIAPSCKGERTNTRSGVRLRQRFLPDGSVKQKAAICSPEASLGKYFCF